MSNGGQGLGAPVVRRIRVLTVIASLLGTFTLVNVVWGALDDLGITEGRPFDFDAIGDADADYPWELANPPQLEIAPDGTLEVPAGGGVLHLEHDPAGRVLQVEARIDPADWIDVSITPEGEDREEEYFYPEGVGYLASEGDVMMLFPAERELEVWFESDAPETLVVSPLEATAFTSSVSGSGNATVIYEGERISAHAVYRGEGTFYVDTYTPSANDSPVIEAGDVDQRFSWEGGGPVVMRIESEGGGGWTIEIEGEEGAPVQLPDPAPSEESGD